MGINAGVEESLNWLAAEHEEPVLKRSISSIIDYGIDQFVGSVSPTGRAVAAIVKGMRHML